MNEDKDKIEITVKVNGEPAFLCDISEETLLNMRKADVEQKIPVARIAWWKNHGRHHLLLKITPEIHQAVLSGNKEISIDLETGRVPYWTDEINGEETKKTYNNIQSLQELNF